MPVQIRNDALVGLLSSDLDSKQNPSLAWAGLPGAFLMLPGLRGFWTGTIHDYSASPTLAINDIACGYNLTSASPPKLGYNNYYPYLEFSASEYMSYPSNAQHDITGLSATYKNPGITFGCVAALKSSSLASQQNFIGKWKTPNDHQYIVYYTPSGSFSCGISMNGIFWDTIQSTVVPVADQIYLVIGRWRPDDGGGNAEIQIIVNNTLTSKITTETSINVGPSNFIIGADHAGGNPLDGYMSLMFLCAEYIEDQLLWVLGANLLRCISNNTV